MRKPTLRTSSRTKKSTKIRTAFKLICFGCLTGSLLFRVFLRADVGQVVALEHRDVVRTCVEFSGPVDSGANVSITMPQQVLAMLSLVEHIFVISLEGCNSRFPPWVASRSTCIHGKVLDNCTPKKFTDGDFEHAMKVTFTHAAIITLSMDAGYKTIAVLEDDLAFVDRDFSFVAAEKFSQLLASNAWNMIRFGFRPYFLQLSGTSHCPSSCRCVTSYLYGEHFCELRNPGCDMRSSDLYILPSYNFLSFRERLLDLRLPNTKRIVDVHPMRAYGKQWILLPQISYQQTLDIPADYQIGAGALFVKKCVGPRPVASSVTKQLVLGSTGTHKPLQSP